MSEQTSERSAAELPADSAALQALARTLIQAPAEGGGGVRSTWEAILAEARCRGVSRAGPLARLLRRQAICDPRSGAPEAGERLATLNFLEGAVSELPPGPRAAIRSRFFGVGLSGSGEELAAGLDELRSRLEREYGLARALRRLLLVLVPATGGAVSWLVKMRGLAIAALVCAALGAGIAALAFGLDGGEDPVDLAGPGPSAARAVPLARASGEVRAEAALPPLEPPNPEILTIRGEPQFVEGPIPGMIHVPAGDVFIGTDPGRIEELLRAHPDEDLQRDLASQCPAQRMRVEGFWIQRSQVTMGLWRAMTWSLYRHRDAPWDVEEIPMRRAVEWEARKRHEERESTPFDRLKWWRECGWRAWERSRNSWNETAPLSLVLHGEAETFCRWLGMRLPSEVEWIRAVRGDTRREYPWVSSWDLEDLSHVPSEWGLADLTDDLYEWTSTPYQALLAPRTWFPGPGPMGFIDPGFDPERRIIKGGVLDPLDSERTSITTRVAHRRSAHVSECSPQIGFRLCVSDRLGRDQLRRTLKRFGLGESRFDLERVSGIQTWGGIAEPPVFYSHRLLLPVRELPAATLADLRAVALERSVPVGVIALSSGVQEPFRGGEYLLRIRRCESAPGELELAFEDRSGGSVFALRERRLWWHLGAEEYRVNLRCTNLHAHWSRPGVEGVHLSLLVRG